jgi:hypothetical protein
MMLPQGVGILGNDTGAVEAAQTTAMELRKAITSFGGRRVEPAVLWLPPLDGSGPWLTSQGADRLRTSVLIAPTGDAKTYDTVAANRICSAAVKGWFTLLSRALADG